MNHTNLLIVIYVILNIFKTSYCFVDPLSFVISTSMLTSLYYLLKSPSSNDLKDTIKTGAHMLCQKIGYCEDCEDYWISSNIDGLEYDLKSSLFGQPFAIDIVLSSLRFHLKSSKPNRPLIFSFQGPPGTGKNFVANKILQHMFRKGLQSDYVHFFRSAIDFPVKEKKAEYMEQILNLIMDKNLQCRRSIYVFDEVEKMPDGLLEVLSAIVKLNSFNDYDFRRSIFILISNSGQSDLIKLTYDTIKRGKKRDDINDKELNKILSTAAYNENGGLQKTGLIKDVDITHYVPFLPLEKENVENCIKDFIKKENQKETKLLISQTLELLTFGKGIYEKFAYAGCKGVSEKAGYLIERELMRLRRKALEV